MVFAERGVRSRIQSARHVPSGKPKRAGGLARTRRPDWNLPSVRQGHVEDQQDVRRPDYHVRGTNQRPMDQDHHSYVQQKGKTMKKKCFDCSGDMQIIQGERKGIAYQAFRCTQCSEVVFDMQQAAAYLKAAEKAKEVTVSKWGESLAIRIPKEWAKALHIKANEKARIIQDKDGFRIIPIPS